MNDAGTLVGGAGAGDDGSYALHAPAPGRYRVTVRRIVVIAV